MRYHFNKTLFITLFGSILLLCAGLINISQANEFTVFGPQNYVRETGGPVVVSDSFSVVNPNTQYTLRVYNGGLEDDATIGEYVSSSEIRVNGALIIGPSNFNQNVQTLEAPVSIQSENEINVELRGKPGGVLTVLVVGVDDSPPAINSISPADGVTLPDLQPAMSAGFTDSISGIDTSSAHIILDGNDVTTDAAITSEGFTYAPPSPLAGGTHTLTVEVSDKAGNTSSVSSTFTTLLPEDIDDDGDGYTENQGDCDDTDPSISPGITEIPYNTKDDDCNPATLDDDLDSDGYLLVNDCDDNDPAAYPGASEICDDGIDQDCDGSDESCGSSSEPQPEGSFGQQYEDLIPPSSTAGSYDPKRFSVINGLVKDMGDSPIPDVSITIHDHLEYGTVLTDATGRFSIPVEGGGTITIVYEKAGLIPSQRQVYVPWNDIAVAKTIIMIPEDPASTAFTFDGSPNTVVAHESTEVTDEFGSRSCTMVFTGDNAAYEVDADGNIIQALPTITTRATEFTTPESMPAILPPTSAYTYCAELSVDGAERVKFDKPVITYVNNFLGFDVGVRVPVGWYDRDRGVWVPSDDGLVVMLLDTDNDGVVDALDSTGDGMPNDMNDNGSFDDEVFGLQDPSRYIAGESYWRVEIKHFSPQDYNWPYGLPGGAGDPNPEGWPDFDKQNGEEMTCETKDIASSVEHRSRIFHEDIPIPGTDMTLHYVSNRVEGYQYPISVPASGTDIPSSLESIIVELQIAGRTFSTSLPALPNQSADFIWDGKDYRGNYVSGNQTAHITIGFVYQAVYYSSNEEFEQSFALPGDDVTGIRARQEIIVWERFERDINVFPRNNAIAEGWTNSLQHTLLLGTYPVLLKGDGRVINPSVHGEKFITTIAGNGTLGSSGDLGPATEAQLRYPYDTAVDSSGNIYLSDSGSNCVRKVDTNGIITTVAGGLNNPIGIAIDTSGNLYITNNYSILMVDPNGIITTVAGNGSRGYSGDGGPATQAQLNNAVSVALDTVGNLYITDRGNQRIRKVDTNGIITTVAGNGNQGYSGDEGPATEAKLLYPWGIDLDTAGNLYIADWNQRIRKVDTSGIITTVAGNGNQGFSGDGGPATEATLYSPMGVAIDSMGNLYIADTSNSRIRKVSTNGTITTIAGNGTWGYSGDGGPAIQAQLAPDGVDVDSLNNIYIAESQNNRIRKLYTSPLSIDYGLTSDELLVREDNGEGHVFESTGRHLKTIDLNTGNTLRTYSYNTENRLIAIIDQFGNETTIQRDTDGKPLSITSPDGILTSLTIDSDNHLKEIRYPDNSAYSFTYTPSGLMTEMIDPNGNPFAHEFNATGRVTRTTDPEGGNWQFDRSVDESGNVHASVLTGEGDLTQYLDTTDSTGAYTSVITGPTGAETIFSQSTDGLTASKSLSCGMELGFSYDIDPEYKFKYVNEMTESTPAALVRSTLRDKTYQDTDTDDIPDLITETVTVNGNPTTLENDTLQSQRTVTSPQGRTITTQYDPATLLTANMSIPGLYDTTYGYDTRGRLTSTITDTREASFVYNAQGFLASITDPEDYTTSYTYDPVGRIIRIDRADQSSLSFSYDPKGNMTVLTKPSTIDHIFDYNGVNLNSSYQTPISGSYSYVYDKDRRLVQTNFPSGKTINNVYDNGRLIQILTPESSIDLSYICSTKVGSITKGTEVITYGYDGSLLTSESISGTMNQSLAYTYNNDFNLASFTYAGDTEGYTYDFDGLLTGAGSFSITRNAANGLPESVSDGTFNLSRTFNGYGEVDSQDFTVGTSLTSLDLTRDNAGRIIAKTEIVDSTPSDYAYTYDPMGRLLTVTKDSTLIEEYQYNQNGTRTYEMNSLRGITGRSLTYSDEDHLLTAGTATYQYDVDGFLTTKTNGTDITTYTYSSRGELLGVTLPDNTEIEYIQDPLGRRIVKMVNGAITEKYLWQGLTRLLAVYDGSDNLIMRFKYADGRMPVAMTKGSSTYYLTYDQVGSLRIVADASGNVIKKIDYDSFGNIINDSDPTFEIPFGFAGGLHDRYTGLVRFGYRDYDPDVGRWTAKDPILFAGGDTDLYGYCLNDPVNYTDPTGEILPALAVYGAYIGLAAIAAGYVNWFYWATHPPDNSPCLGGGDQREPKPAVLPRTPIPGPPQHRKQPIRAR